MASKLLRKRKKLGYLQKWVAARAGIEVRTLWSLEQGKSRPKYNTALRLAQVLHCNINDLFDEIA